MRHRCCLFASSLTIGCYAGEPAGPICWQRVTSRWPGWSRLPMITKPRIFSEIFGKTLGHPFALGSDELGCGGELGRQRHRRRRQLAERNSAILPAPPRSQKYLERHNGFNERVKQGKVDLVFIGDSITHFWETDGKAVWKECYARRNAVGLGIAGDRTQHVLWRIEHGNLDGIAPKLAILMIGTNNARTNTPEQTAEGIAAIVHAIQIRTPATIILLLGIFPRGRDAADPLRRTNQKVNQTSPGSTTARASSTSTSGQSSWRPTARSPRRSYPTSSTLTPGAMRSRPRRSSRRSNN
jgi:lysophospholipase L1-like esterase